jgi:hypothetical protein
MAIHNCGQLQLVIIPHYGFTPVHTIVCNQWRILCCACGLLVQHAPNVNGETEHGRLSQSQYVCIISCPQVQLSLPWSNVTCSNNYKFQDVCFNILSSLLPHPSLLLSYYLYCTHASCHCSCCPSSLCDLTPGQSFPTTLSPNSWTMFHQVILFSCSPNESASQCQSRHQMVIVVQMPTASNTLSVSVFSIVLMQLVARPPCISISTHRIYTMILAQIFCTGRALEK